MNDLTNNRAVITDVRKSDIGIQIETLCSDCQIGVAIEGNILLPLEVYSYIANSALRDRSKITSHNLSTKVLK